MIRDNRKINIETDFFDDEQEKEKAVDNQYLSRNNNQNSQKRDQALIVFCNTLDTIRLHRLICAFNYLNSCKKYPKSSSRQAFVLSQRQQQRNKINQKSLPKSVHYRYESENQQGFQRKTSYIPHKARPQSLDDKIEKGTFLRQQRKKILKSLSKTLHQNQDERSKKQTRKKSNTKNLSHQAKSELQGKKGAESIDQLHIKNRIQKLQKLMKNIRRQKQIQNPTIIYQKKHMSSLPKKQKKQNMKIFIQQIQQLRKQVVQIKKMNEQILHHSRGRSIQSSRTSRVHSRDKEPSNRSIKRSEVILYQSNRTAENENKSQKLSKSKQRPRNERQQNYSKKGWLNKNHINKKKEQQKQEQQFNRTSVQTDKQFYTNDNSKHRSLIETDFKKVIQMDESKKSQTRQNSRKNISSSQVKDKDRDKDRERDLGMQANYQNNRQQFEQQTNSKQQTANFQNKQQEHGATNARKTTIQKQEKITIFNKNSPKIKFSFNPHQGHEQQMKKWQPQVQQQVQNPQPEERIGQQVINKNSAMLNSITTKNTNEFRMSHNTNHNTSNFIQPYHYVTQVSSQTQTIPIYQQQAQFQHDQMLREEPPMEINYLNKNRHIPVTKPFSSEGMWRQKDMDMQIYEKNQKISPWYHQYMGQALPDMNYRQVGYPSVISEQEMMKLKFYEQEQPPQMNLHSTMPLNKESGYRRFAQAKQTVSHSNNSKFNSYTSSPVSNQAYGNEYQKSGQYNQQNNYKPNHTNINNKANKNTFTTNNYQEIFTKYGSMNPVNLHHMHHGAVKNVNNAIGGSGVRQSPEKDKHPQMRIKIKNHEKPSNDRDYEGDFYRSKTERGTRNDRIFRMETNQNQIAAQINKMSKQKKQQKASQQGYTDPQLLMMFNIGPYKQGSNPSNSVIGGQQSQYGIKQSDKDSLQLLIQAQEQPNSMKSRKYLNNESRKQLSQMNSYTYSNTSITNPIPSHTNTNTNTNTNIDMIRIRQGQEHGHEHESGQHAHTSLRELEQEYNKVINSQNNFNFKKRNQYNLQQQQQQ